MNWQSTHRIRQAAAVLGDGGVIAYPTEAVWGLGCDPQNSNALAHVLAMKHRAESKGVILIAANIPQVLPYLGGILPQHLKLLSQSRTVPTTWIVPAGPLAPAWITGGRNTLAIRITSHPLAAALCNAFGGPIVSTSANPNGKPPARTSLRVRCYFPGDQVFIVPGSVGGAAKPSEIRQLATGEILRAGA